MTGAGKIINKKRVNRLLGRETFGVGRLPLHVRRHVLDGGHQPHDHDFMEIALIHGGTGLHCTIYGEQKIEAGNVFLLRPGTWHDYRECRGLEVYNCCFGLDLWRREMASLHRDPALHYLFWAGPSALLRRGLLRWNLPSPALTTCLQHLNAMEVSRDANGIETSIEQIGHLLLLMALLAHHMEEGDRNSLERMRPPNPTVEIAARLLQDQCERNWSLGELASQVHLDPSYLVRLFKQDVGLSPMAYLARCRLERAAGMLLRSSQPITEIAASVGWSDPNYFARRFKKHFGVSASDYRQRTDFSSNKIQ